MSLLGRWDQRPRHCSEDRSWSRDGAALAAQVRASAGGVRSQVADAWWVPDDAAYCYLLGTYLGDGTVSLRSAGAARVQVVNDRRYECYESILREILAAMATTFPGGTPRVHPSSTGESDVLCISHPAILRAFPQHGRGRKRNRAIMLEAWQQKITGAHPGALVRGLIHSKGCRAVNRFSTRLPGGRVADAPTSGTSSQITPRTSEASSPSTAGSWESASRGRITATFPSCMATAWRSSTSSAPVPSPGAPPLSPLARAAPRSRRRAGRRRCRSG
jgi:hypothetical protein